MSARMSISKSAMSSGCPTCAIDDARLAFLLAIEVVLTKHESHAALQVRTESFPQIVVGDPQRLHVGSGDPAEEVCRDLDVERVAARHGPEDACRGDVVGKMTKYCRQLCHHLPLEFVLLAWSRIHPAPELAHLREHPRRKGWVRPGSDHRNHAVIVRASEVFGLQAVQVGLDEVFRNNGYEGEPFLMQVQGAFGNLAEHPLARPGRVSCMQMLNRGSNEIRVQGAQAVAW